jgi:hypothetical protein
LGSERLPKRFQMEIEPSKQREPGRGAKNAGIQQLDIVD